MQSIFPQIFGYGWPSDEQLVEFARSGHGYMGNDGYYGVTYASDLDEYERVVERRSIGDNHVEITYWDGEPRSIQVAEAVYLEALAAYLESRGKKEAASALEGLAAEVRAKGT
ncbi:hypothetical protein G4G28_07765 [Massilia sp. Dwa41.01b]|uniref:hypothetical protein n=1 Tax=unclassified Massilia TaxID=2609279 RepID=UPI001600872B|nr:MULTISPECIES: hypothetical protein [unclassified Massilia]QNA88419.1 hypothetical protein G4G28_07765 [Massilia sp. Dwa41.01b]QNA99314.1 hypothetical protein G4G31_11450 [Massilia sp. Se16.2.3]